MRASQKSYGRVDWMPRAKVWRVVWYTRRDIEIGRYTSYDEAAQALQDAVQHRRAS